MFKQILFTITLLSLVIFLNACTSNNTTISTSNTSSQTPSSVVNENQPIPTQINTYQLNEITSKRETSCFYYELQNQNQEPVSTNKQLTEILSCPFTLPILTPNKQSLIYLDNNFNLYLYNIETQEQTKLINFYQDTDGINLLSWSPDQSKLLIMAVNYEATDYPEISKIFILNFTPNFKLINKNKYNIKVNFSCGSANCSPQSNDIQWLSNTELEYQTWDKSPYDLTTPHSKQILYIKP